DVEEDRQTTQAVLRGQYAIDDGRKNWLGHRIASGAAYIAELLINGANLKLLGGKRGAVLEHLYHLKKDHGLDLACRDGVWSFARKTKEARKERPRKRGR